jgi:prepilin peptidase CpaA
MRPWNWSVSRCCWHFSLSPAGSPVSGDRLDRFPIVHLSPLDSGDAPTSRQQHGLCNPMILDIARLLLFPALMAFAAASDLLTMTISNRVSLALAAGFLALALLSGMGLYDILSHVGAGAAILAVAFACFAMGWVGGGDAKIAAAAALWFGFGHLLNYLIYASLFGGALTLLLLQFRQWPLPYPFVGQAWLIKLHAKDSGIPYGIALAVGALMIYPETEWIKAVDLTHFAIR